MATRLDTYWSVGVWHIPHQRHRQHGGRQSGRSSVSGANYTHICLHDQWICEGFFVSLSKSFFVLQNLCDWVDCKIPVESKPPFHLPGQAFVMRNLLVSHSDTIQSLIRRSEHPAIPESRRLFFRNTCLLFVDVPLSSVSSFLLDAGILMGLNYGFTLYNCALPPPVELRYRCPHTQAIARKRCFHCLGFIGHW